MIESCNQSAPTSSTTTPVCSAAQIEAIRMTIDKLIADNLTNNTTRAVAFSRACGACDSVSSENRYASVACGHAVCRACADGRTTCRVCDKTTTFIQLVEQATRECKLCRCAEPIKRGFFVGCGHIQCDGCIGDTWYRALVNNIRFECSECKQRSRPIKLREKKIIRHAPSIVKAGHNCTMEAKNQWNLRRCTDL